MVLACLAGVMLGNSLSFGIYALVGSLVAADRITRAQGPGGHLPAGLFTGAVNLVAVLFLFLADGKGLTRGHAAHGAVRLPGHGAGGAGDGDGAHAADRGRVRLRLGHQAAGAGQPQPPGAQGADRPGAGHLPPLASSSGTLVEDAAEAIGANPLLARSCAYYHDIGKGRNPLYFGENQKGENRHDTLAPAMSAVIIKRHVTEGLEMARQYQLPKLVADAIPQHHGTRLVGYFFHKALKEQEGKENPQPIDESIYRYPGPKPQFREAALVMIADAVEAATRADARAHHARSCRRWCRR